LFGLDVGVTREELLEPEVGFGETFAHLPQVGLDPTLGLDLI